MCLWAHICKTPFVLLFLCLHVCFWPSSLEKERESITESLLVFHPFVQRNTHKNTHTHIHMHTHTLSCKTTWLPTASPPASSAARDLARLIIFLLIECRGTLQGWVIKLMQRMFVSTVYLSTAKRYIRHTAHRHKHTHTHTHMQGYRYLHSLRANKYK